MTSVEKYFILSIFLFFASAILHIFMVISEGIFLYTIMILIFGILFFILGFLLQLKRKDEILGKMSILFPVADLILCIIFLIIPLYPISDSYYIFLIYFIVVDSLIIPLRIIIFLNL